MSNYPSELFGYYWKNGSKDDTAAKEQYTCPVDRFTCRLHRCTSAAHRCSRRIHRCTLSRALLLPLLHELLYRIEVLPCLLNEGQMSALLEHDEIRLRAVFLELIGEPRDGDPVESPGENQNGHLKILQLRPEIELGNVPPR